MSVSLSHSKQIRPLASSPATEQSILTTKSPGRGCAGTGTPVVQSIVPPTAPPGWVESFRGEARVGGGLPGSHAPAGEARAEPPKTTLCVLSRRIGGKDPHSHSRRPCPGASWPALARTHLPPPPRAQALWSSRRRAREPRRPQLVSLTVRGAGWGARELPHTVPAETPPTLLPAALGHLRCP